MENQYSEIKLEVEEFLTNFEKDEIVLQARFSGVYANGEGKCYFSCKPLETHYGCIM